MYIGCNSKDGVCSVCSRIHLLQATTNITLTAYDVAYTYSYHVVTTTTKTPVYRARERVSSCVLVFPILRRSAVCGRVARGVACCAHAARTEAPRWRRGRGGRNVPAEANAGNRAARATRCGYRVRRARSSPAGGSWSPLKSMRARNWPKG